MHPALQLRRLAGLDKEIVAALAARPEGLAQVAVGQWLAERLDSPPSQSKLSRLMTRLIQAGLLRKEGTTRARYILTQDAAWFALPSHLRPPVQYDPSRIDRYMPNVTRWLPAPARARMESAARGVANQLDASTYSKQIAERFLIDLSWASSALEGNTYDQLDTEALLKFGQRAAGHDVLEATMILNHKHAIAELLDQVGGDVLHVHFVARLHAMLMRDLLSPEDLGRVRATDVVIGGSSYRPAGDTQALEAALGSLLWKAGQVQDPFEASFLILAGASYLQAFVDGNTRVGRLVCNVPLLWQGKPPMSFIGIDKADYLTGLIVFYEIGDTTVLAETMAAAYDAAAPSYSAAVATRRIPRAVELRQRQRVESMVQSYVADALAGRVHPPAAFADGQLRDLEDDDRKVLVDAFANIVAALTPVNAAAWGVAAQEAERFATVRQGSATAAGQQFDFFTGPRKR